VDATYDLALPGITEASWIQRHLEREHGVGYELVPNGIRKDIYRSEGAALSARGATEGLRILVEGAFGVPFKNVGRTLKLMRRARVGETWLLTPSGVGSIPGVARVFSRVPISATAPIYRACDVLVKLSYVEGMFGPPLEMFHCGGTAIVYGVTGYDEYIEHGKNALVLPQGDEDGVVAAVRSLRRDRDLLDRLQAGARATAEEWPSWTTSSGMFEGALSSIASAEKVDRSDLEAHSRAALQEYARATMARPAWRPATRFRTAARVLSDRLPEAVRRPLRHAAYILETR
jgi:glycosyltransferase involved in cell wall biosynthesis